MNKPVNLRNQLILSGEPAETINGNKLPPNKQVLKLLFHQTREKNKTLSASYQFVAKEVIKIWNNAVIQVQATSRGVKKVEKLYNNYRSVQKNPKTEGEFSSYLEKII